ncbi:MAG: hypothetical protein IPO37_12620 [Saprospiraceae bacterium]|nr:hypothetical protein [Saprospiraceae bacterium]
MSNRMYYLRPPSSAFHQCNFEGRMNYLHLPSLHFSRQVAFQQTGSITARQVAGGHSNRIRLGWGPTGQFRTTNMKCDVSGKDACGYCIVVRTLRRTGFVVALKSLITR